MQGKFEVDRYETNKATYLGMGVEKGADSDSEGIIPDSDNYEGGINRTEIPHERTKHRNEALTEEEQAILRTEL